MFHKRHKSTRATPSVGGTVIDPPGDDFPREPQRLFNVMADVSSSMQGAAIAAVNEKFADFLSKCRNDAVIRPMLQIQLVTFGGTVRVHPFAPVARFAAPTLTASGGTPLAEAVFAGAASTHTYAERLRKTLDVDLRQTQHFLLTDGAPTSASSLLQQMAQLVAQIERAKQGEFHAFGTTDAAVEALQSWFPRSYPLHRLADFFEILLSSVRLVSLRSTSDRCELTPFIHNQLLLSNDKNANA